MNHHPLPFGIRQDFCLTKKECHLFKVPLAFHVLKVGDWANIDLVLNELLQDGIQRSEAAKRVKGEIVNALKIIARHRCDYAPVASYCSSLVDWYKSPKIHSAFADAFDLALEKAKAIQRGRLNGIKLPRLGAVHFGKELDNSLDDFDTNKENNPSSSADTTSLYTTSATADGIPFQGSTLGTAIKRKALNIFQQWSGGKVIDNDQLHWMKCGLSSIVDLVDEESTKKFLGCTDSEWTAVVHPLVTKCLLVAAPLPAVVAQTWDVVDGIIARTNHTDKAKEYIAKVKTNTVEEKKLLNVISVVLHVIDSNQFLLDPTNVDRVTEYDFIVQVWTPLLKSIVDIHGLLRLKIGESSPKAGTMARKRQYGDVNVGFKEDIRILYDSRTKEHDLMCVEAAKNGLDSKLSSDLSKLMREAKDDLDDSLQHILATHLNSFPNSFFMQVNGTEGMVGSIHLARPGVYAAVHQGEINFPRTFSSFSQFKAQMLFLVNVIYKLERNATMVRNSMDRMLVYHEQKTLRNSIHRTPDVLEPNHYAYATRPTFYNPPKDDPLAAKLPINLFGSPSLMAFSSAPPSPDTSVSEADEYGWAKAGDKFFNIYSLATSDHHPFDGYHKTPMLPTAASSFKFATRRPLAMTVRHMTKSSSVTFARTSMEDPMDHTSYQFAKNEDHHQVAPLTSSGIYVANSSVDDRSIFTPTINAVFDE
ncbi:hypothetical protein DM01DRAFT_1411796 [Hesseltinella vesiculosa]|uniref:Uncharacterized protein n=1 Tax=Hesseltinella vesiculosa TaxID=101127 RepID=A0A1X2G284_9FUNG|nr:hypothetical protein DM01DRAFT_1411796 [Hesseltinella vesiculosa]